MQARLPLIAALAAGGLLMAYGAKHRRPLQHYHDIVRDMAGRDLDVMDVRVPLLPTLGGAVALVAGGLLLARELRGMRSEPGHVSMVEESIELDVPVSTAYNQWTQFEEFPKFMATVQSVEQLDDTHLRWRAVVGGKVKEWIAEITEQIPDERIAWQSTGGVHNSGVVTFHKISDARTRVMLQMEYRPESMVERAGAMVGGVKLTTKGNLMRFKKLLEGRGHESGAWRGTVHH